MGEAQRCAPGCSGPGNARPPLVRVPRPRNRLPCRLRCPVCSIAGWAPHCLRRRPERRDQATVASPALFGYGSRRTHAGYRRRTSPFWAPDSEWVGFFAGNSLKTIRVPTGVVQPVAPNVSTMAGAAWNADNEIVFTGGPAVLLQVSARGGPVSRVITKGDGSYFWPQFLADGKHYLYADTVAREIRLGLLASEGSKILMKFPVRPSSLAYVPGYVFLVQDATLFARPFDEKRLVFSGEPIRLLDGIPVTPPGRAPFSVSPTGLLAYWTYPAAHPPC